MHEWRLMTAGRDLDQLIAERMGWTQIKLGWNSIDHDFDLEGAPPKDGHGVLHFLGHWSTDVNDALCLPVKELYFIDLHSPVGDPDYDNGKREWNAFIEWVWEDEEDDAPTYQAVADTAALAICRAWLAYRDADAASSAVPDAGDADAPGEGDHAH